MENLMENLELGPPKLHFKYLFVFFMCLYLEHFLCKRLLLIKVSSEAVKHGKPHSGTLHRFMQLAEDSSRQAFQSIESIVHAFGSVSMMLESTYHAVYRQVPFRFFL